MDNNENNQFNEQDNFEFDNISNDSPAPESEIEKIEEPQISDAERERQRARRERLRKEREEERKRKEEEEERRRKNLKGTLTVFGVLAIIMFLIYFGLTNQMPKFFMEKGEEHFKAGNYEQAYKMFDRVSNSKPYDEEPMYKKTVALSKMEANYENQKALYEISELENHDKASEYATEVLQKTRTQIDRQVGSNYAGNALYDGILFRWNPSKPITYYISSKQSQKINADIVRKSFKDWQRESDDIVMFQETSSHDSADIQVYLTNGVIEGNNDINAAGNVNPIISENNALQRVEITLKTGNNPTHYYDINKFETLAKHEIGHALGLWGHSANPTDMMYHKNDQIDNIKIGQQITNRDINSLHLLYSMVPDAIDRPLTAAEKNNLLYHPAVTAFPGADYELEIRRLMEGLSANPQDIVVWVDIAINHGVNKMYLRSNTILHKILPLVTNDIHNQFVVLYNIAANYYKLKEYGTSRRFLDLALNFNDDIDTQVLEAFLDLKEGKKELGKKKLENLNKAYPNHIEVALKLTYIYYGEKNRAKATQILENLVQVNPKAKLDRRVMKYYSYNARTSKEARRSTLK